MLLRRSSQNPGSHRGVEDRKVGPPCPAHSASLCAACRVSKAHCQALSNCQGASAKREAGAIPRPPRKQPDTTVCGTAPSLFLKGPAHPAQTIKFGAHQFRTPPHSGHLDTFVSRCAAPAPFLLTVNGRFLFGATEKKMGVHPPSPLAGGLPHMIKENTPWQSI